MKRDWNRDVTGVETGPRRSARVGNSPWLLQAFLWLLGSITLGLGQAGYHPAAAATSTDVADIAGDIERSQRRLLELKGGWELRCRLDVESDLKKDFVYRSVLTTVRVKWPKIHVTIYGEDVHGREPQRRAATYDFVERTSRSAAYRKKLNEWDCTRYRHAWSAAYLFPLAWQYFAEANQYYFPGSQLQTDYWLPEAILQHEYQLDGEEDIAGIPCRILKRPGYDVVWVATKHGNVICRRDIYFGPGRPLRERVQNLDLKEIAPGVWLPTRQIKELFATTDDVPARWNQVNQKLVLTVTKLSIGNLQDKQLELKVPENAMVSDAIRGIYYQKLPKGRDGLEENVRLARRELKAKLQKAHETTSYSALLWANVVVVLFMGIFFVLRRLR